MAEERGSLQLNDIYELIKQELGSETNPQKIDSNLAAIVSILAKQNLTTESDQPEIIPFEISEKINFNDLGNFEYLISDNVLNTQKMIDIYSTFDLEGMNKSYSVLNYIRSLYTRNKTTKKGVELFDKIVEEATKIVKESKNYNELPVEELDLCMKIVIVDAFIRCKIFENPKAL